MNLPTPEPDAQSDAKQALLKKIQSLAIQTNSANTTLLLAEAYAWVVTPNNSHGGSSAKSS